MATRHEVPNLARRGNVFTWRARVPVRFCGLPATRQDHGATPAVRPPQGVPFSKAIESYSRYELARAGLSDTIDNRERAKIECFKAPTCSWTSRQVAPRRPGVDAAHPVGADGRGARGAVADRRCRRRFNQDLKRHVRDWWLAYNDAKQLEALRCKTPLEALELHRADESERLGRRPGHNLLGLDIQVLQPRPVSGRNRAHVSPPIDRIEVVIAAARFLDRREPKLRLGTVLETVRVTSHPARSVDDGLIGQGVDLLLDLGIAENALRHHHDEHVLLRVHVEAGEEDARPSVLAVGA